MPDSFRLEIGGFRVGADTKLALNRGGASEVVDFESDLDLEETGNRAFLEVFWRPGRRHLLSVAYQRFDREGPGRTLQRDITWGGVLTTAGDVVFSGGKEGYFFALDARTGELLWKASVGGQVNAGPMSYSVGGRQYVTIAAGSSLFAYALPQVQ